jgi:hypothetical protein
VVGADPGSNYDKARSLGVTIQKEDDLDDFLAGRRKSEADRAPAQDASANSRGKGRSKKASSNR